MTRHANTQPGRCISCGKWVPALGGQAVRTRDGWRVQHGRCAILDTRKPASAPRRARKPVRAILEA